MDPSYGPASAGALTAVAIGLTDPVTYPSAGAGVPAGGGVMIRPMEPRDVPRMVQLAVDTGMFPAEAAGFLEGAAAAWFAGGPGRWVVDELDGTVVGVAFYEPRPATDRVWFLTMLAVAPALHGRGRGAALVAGVEAALREAGERLLLIETSSTPAYDRTRRFYEKLGYAAVARVPGYFTDGDDMVLFRKDLRER